MAGRYATNAKYKEKTRGMRELVNMKKVFFSIVKEDLKNLGKIVFNVKNARQVFGSVPFMIAETLLSILIVALGQEVFGAVLFVGLISLKLLVCDDVLPTTLPFLLLCSFVTNCYDSFNTFIGYAVYAPVVVLCVIYHFIAYAKPMRTGESVYGILAVTAAVMLGGIGNFSVREYAYGSYYIFGLGAGMLVAYYLMKSQFSVRRKYDIRKRFALIMTLMGVLCTAIVVIGYIRVSLDAVFGHYPTAFSRNNISTMLMFAMPFPLYLSGKVNRFWAVFTAIFVAAICATTSRGGLLFGGVECLVCCAYWILTGKHKLWRGIFCAAGLAFIIACSGEVMKQVFEDRLTGDVIEGDARYKMIWEAFARFKENPFVGSGILDDSITYGGFNKKGTMAWYHMMIPQIIGSMGLLGVAAYGFQAFMRGKAVFTSKNKWSLCLGISYLGILMMSQVNPGEFCPLPFELLTVLLFILQERRLEEFSLPVAQEYWER